jgi:hypothetical protein
MKIIAVGHLADDLLGLALDALDDARDGFFDSIALSHVSLPSSDFNPFAGHVAMRSRRPPA